MKNTENNEGNAEGSILTTSKEPLAIVGIGCRYPGGSTTPQAFWDMLGTGEDAICDIPPERWDFERYYSSDVATPGKMYIKQGGFLKEPIDSFDAGFFGISPREAIYIDPQQRLLLESAWEAMEDSGDSPADLAGSNTGVYCGCFTLDSMVLQMSPYNRSTSGTNSATGASMTMVANRISYCFDLRGPSFTLDTACSSSLVATHEACQAIWRGEISGALVGGANTMICPEYPVLMCKGHFLSADGRSKSFDSRADGYARGEGAGVVYIKPYADALRDGNPIYALIRGTGANQDGRTDGITVPNPESQESLIRTVYEKSGIPFEDVRYVEAHGTGTTVGDTVEANVLGRTFGSGRRNGDAVLVGSVKSTIGHLEAGAGVAGLIKASLCLKHNEVPPQANLIDLNPTIPFDDLGLKVVQDKQKLPEDGRPVCVGINSFGYGGTNAHIILERAPQEESNIAEISTARHALYPEVLVLSARDTTALTELAKSYSELLSCNKAPELRDVCYSAAVHRPHHEHRLAVVGLSNAEVSLELDDFVESGVSSQSVLGTTHSKSQRDPVFVFTGMGPQWWAMGRELFEREPVFHQSAKAVDEIFQSLANWSILEEMLADEGKSRMQETQIAQPANFLIQVALTDLLRSWGVVPSAIVGHSVGEVSAAYVSGALSLEDAVCVSFHRSRLQQSAAGQGSMLAVGLSGEQAEALIADKRDLISIAAINGATAVTLSGDQAALEAVAESLTEREVFNRFLRVEVAYHSPQMDHLKDDMLAALKNIKPQIPTIPLYSTVTGGLVEEAISGPQYWCDNIRQPVFFAKAIGEILAAGYEGFLEVGPHPVLGGSIKEAVRSQGKQEIVIPTLRRGENEQSMLLLALGGLYVNGYRVDWKTVTEEGARYVKLPTYPWQREVHWNETAVSKHDRTGKLDHPLLGLRSFSPTPTWQSELNREMTSYVDDHIVEGTVIFPAAGYIEQGLAMQALINDNESGILEDIEFQSALVLQGKQEPILKATFDEDSSEYRIFTRREEDGWNWTLHANGRIINDRPVVADPLAMEDLKSRCDTEVDVDKLYGRLAEHGLQYGPEFQRIRQLYRGSGEVLSEIATVDASKGGDRYHLHPGVLDAALQSLIAGLDWDASDKRTFVPVGIKRISHHQRLNGQCWSYGRILQQSDERITGEIVLCDSGGNVAAEIKGVRLQSLISLKEHRAKYMESCSYVMTWEEGEPVKAASAEGNWLLLSDRSGVGSALADKLAAGGAAEIEQLSAEAVSSVQQESQSADEEDVIQPFDAQLQKAGAGSHVVYLWGLDEAAQEDPSEGRAHVEFLHLAQAIGRLEPEQAPKRVYVVTRGAQLLNEEQGPDLSQAYLVGLARTALSEFPHTRCTLIDLDPDASAEQLQELLEEILSDSTESDVALRGEVRYVHRLAPLARMKKAEEEKEQQMLSAEEAGDFTLRIGSLGRFESLYYEQIQRRPPGPGEIELRMHAAALNFKDILKTLGMLPEAALESTFHQTSLGMEGTAEIVAVGEGVTDYKVGDMLVGGFRDSFSMYITVAVDDLFAVPASPLMSITDSASIPTIFLTAYYALNDIARLKKGEYVLIHAAAGGVGLAAIQVAQWLGATVIATVGSEEKREYLRSIGVEHIFNSRNLEFADGIKKVTNGKGVNVVLNSLSKETIIKSLEAMAPLGRFVEIGKRDIVQNIRMPMLAFNRNLSYTAIDLDRFMGESPEVLDGLFEKVWALFHSRDLKPTPVKVYPASQIADAFKYMAQSKQIGKIVVDFDDLTGVEVKPQRDAGMLLKPDASYLVTGGLGGFGLEIAKWMVDEGARHLALVGRSGAKTDEAKQCVKMLQDQGVSVNVICADMGKQEDVVAMFDNIAKNMPPLKGVMHAAAVLDDALLANLDEARLRKVAAPKARGAWLLHKHTENLSLDHFVLFSSVSALMGSPGQGNYVAANVFLDSLAEYRQARGLPATSVNWGALAEVGMVAKDTVVFEQLARAGINAIRPKDACSALAEALWDDRTQLGFMDMNWAKWGQLNPAASAIPSLSYVVGASSSGKNAEASKIRAALLSVDEGDRAEMLALMIVELVSETMHKPANKIDINMPLSDMGIDSLMAVELQYGVSTRFGVDIPVLELVRSGCILELAGTLLDHMKVAHEGSASSTQATTERDTEQAVA
ncbi:MAG: type I polyketide synthase [Candidatus Thiodiazotropha taylori]|nr:type I polyketide synthase [Candidatus Thiodiazotropha taylori]